jgi:D-threo-aldose 1-dehydrogenase
MARVAAIERVGVEFVVPLQAAALQFPAAHPAVATVIPGARSVAELDANVRMARWPIPREFWSALRERGLVDPRAPLPGDSPSPHPFPRTPGEGARSAGEGSTQ